MIKCWVLINFQLSDSSDSEIYNVLHSHHLDDLESGVLQTLSKLRSVTQWMVSFCCPTNAVCVYHRVYICVLYVYPLSMYVVIVFVWCTVSLNVKLTCFSWFKSWSIKIIKHILQYTLKGSMTLVYIGPLTKGLKNQLKAKTGPRTSQKNPKTQRLKAHGLQQHLFPTWTQSVPTN